jgi:hypothetical protein
MKVTVIDNVVGVYMPDSSDIGLKVMSEFQKGENVLVLYANSKGHQQLIGHIKRTNDTAIFKSTKQTQDNSCGNCKWSSAELSKGLYDKETGITLLNCLQEDNQPNIKTAASVIVLPTSWCKHWREKLNESQDLH